MRECDREEVRENHAPNIESGVQLIPNLLFANDPEAMKNLHLETMNERTNRNVLKCGSRETCFQYLIKKNSCRCVYFTFTIIFLHMNFIVVTSACLVLCIQYFDIHFHRLHYDRFKKFNGNSLDSLSIWCFSHLVFVPSFISLHKIRPIWLNSNCRWFECK